MLHSQSYQQETSQQMLHHGKRRPLPASREGAGNREVMSHPRVMVGSAEMPKKRFQIPLSLENCYKKVTSVFSSLAIQIVGYYTWSLKSLSDTPPCEKDCPATTGSLYQRYYRPTSSYVTDEHPYGTSFFRSSYLL